MARLTQLQRLNSKWEFVINESNQEKQIIKLFTEFPFVIQEAAAAYSPALLTNYIYSLVKEYNNYYQSTLILTADSDQLIHFRLALSLKLGEIIKTGMQLLGITVPERM